MLSHEAITEFKKLWVTRYNRELTDNEALAKATALLALLKPIYRQIPNDRSDHEL